MLFDVRLDLHYDYDASVHGDRHLLRITPVSIPGVQRVIAAALSFKPRPQLETTHTDFFGNTVTTLGYGGYHDELDVRLSVRVNVEDLFPPDDVSPPLDRISAEIAAIWSIGPNSPHHFLAASPRVAVVPKLTRYARESFARTSSVQAGVLDFCQSIYRDFAYDAKATRVDTTPVEAFELKRGVCQDFAHVMISGLRGVGVPAAYVSGFLRTIPPEGKPRLAGADAMHAWVRAWCGQNVGWVEFDPTNNIIAGPDHITIGHGRDYGDISPIVGVLKTSGAHKTTQAVDVVRVE